MSKSCLAYFLLSSFACVLFMGFMFYEFGDSVEPWRNFRWQLFAIACVVAGLIARYDPIQEWISQTGNSLPFFEWRPLQIRYAIVLGVVIFLLSWL